LIQRCVCSYAMFHGGKSLRTMRQEAPAHNVAQSVEHFSQFVHYLWGFLGHQCQVMLSVPDGQLLAEAKMGQVAVQPSSTFVYYIRYAIDHA
jgi:hypothetical protein